MVGWLIVVGVVGFWDGGLNDQEGGWIDGWMDGWMVVERENWEMDGWGREWLAGWIDYW